MDEGLICFSLFWLIVFIPFFFIYIKGKVRENAMREKEYWRRFNERLRYLDAMISKEAGFEEF